MWRKDCSVEATAGKTSQGHLSSCPHHKPTGSSITPPPCSKSKDAAVPIVTKQETPQDSRCKLTTKHGSIYVDRQIMGMMNIDQTGRFTRSPVIILERLQEDKVKTRSSQVCEPGLSSVTSQRNLLLSSNHNYMPNAIHQLHLEQILCS